MKIVFLSYINRSGSTYLLNQLSKSSEVCVCPEADILFDLFLETPNKCIAKEKLIKINQKLSSDNKFIRWNINLEQLLLIKGTQIELFYHILKLYRNTHYPLANIIVFKHNNLLTLFDKIKDKRDVQWLSLLREPKAIYASQKNTISPFTQKYMCSNPISLIDQWNQFYKKTKEINHTEYHYTIFYEELLSKFDYTMQQVFSALSIQIPWVKCKEQDGVVYNYLTENYQEIHKNINEAPNFESINKWKTLLKQYEVRLLNILMLQNADYLKTTSPKLFLTDYFRIIYFRLNRKLLVVRKKLSPIFKPYA